MDMDMDVPLPEELEWLEANSHFHDDYEDFEPPESYPEKEEDEPQIQQPSQDHQLNQEPARPTLSIPSIPTAVADYSLHHQTQLNGKKRFRSDGPNSSDHDRSVQSEEKRGRLDSPVGVIDEEWLNYSPPQWEAKNIESAVAEEEKIVSRYASEIDGDCIPVTGTGGDRVYAKISRVKEDRSKKLDIKAYSNGLISESINILMQRVEHDAFMKALQDSADDQSDEILPEAPVEYEKLWVDKYAPNSFMELLSDEQTNREVLLWLKQWDFCVFGSEIRNTTDDVLYALKRHSSVAQHHKLSDWSSFGKTREYRFSKGTSEIHNDLDHENKYSKCIPELWNKKAKSSSPPEQKVLLLCGPPGLGKTTLAHITARHCGYHVVEVNASDDRSSSTIEAKILDVVQMNSVIADSKPKCLVIDEIDGALGDGRGAVEVILKMVSDEKKADTGKENIAKDQSGRTSSKKKRKNVSLSRPIICICNDLYAPALRPLRQVAKVHMFTQPTVSRVVSRLRYICSKEGLKTSSIALTALAEYTECDIRSCLNTLQFLNRKKETLNVLEISSQVVGQKDTTKSVFDIWKEIFQKKRAKRERKTCSGGNIIPNDFENLHSLLSFRGDHDLISDGIHENILQLRYHDPLMQKTVKSLHNLGNSDIIYQYSMRTQQMSLQVYLPTIAIAVHGLIAQVEKPNIEWPKSFHRSRTMLMEKVDILRSWHNKMSPYISRHLSTKAFVEDSVSPLLHILSPPTLRPVAMNLLLEKERHDLVQLVKTMVSYSITYKNVNCNPLPRTLAHETTLDASTLLFDPPIGDLIKFKGYRSSHFVLALAVKQVLVHEVEKQKILQGSINGFIEPTEVRNKSNKVLAWEENARARHPTSDHAPSENLKSAKNSTNLGKFEPICPAFPLASESPGNSLGSSKIRFTGDAKKTSNLPSSFFDRFRKLSSKGSQNSDNAEQRPTTLERDSRPLLFKFNEGFTNAVKRPVRIKEFLL